MSKPQKRKVDLEFEQESFADDLINAFMIHCRKNNTSLTNKTLIVFLTAKDERNGKTIDYKKAFNIRRDDGSLCKKLKTGLLLILTEAEFNPTIFYGIFAGVSTSFKNGLHEILRIPQEPGTYNFQAFVNLYIVDQVNL